LIEGMSWIIQNLWLIPALPLAAAGLTAITPQQFRRFSAGAAILSMGFALVLSCLAFGQQIQTGTTSARSVVNFHWVQYAPERWIDIGWILDPLTSVMLVMVCFVGLLIFIYSLGYMKADENFTRFFCFLSLFAAAMLGLIIANSLLLLFICWEVVGLTSYLLIGFWYHRPSAAAAAKKAFIVTRVGDLALFIGMLWWFSKSGTLVFYDHGAGCLEGSTLAGLAGQISSTGLAVSTGIGLLIFCGAIGKSGQVPLHVWLPDAMEGPTPVSALIHAATMVAAGVFLVARVFPLMNLHPAGSGVVAPVLQVVAWVGVVTALFAASIAIAQTDIKRILAYSTVSQLGFMMMGLAMGGVAVGMFHLITHAFFKALLFLGAGSVIHGSHEEQDITRMGGLKRLMPATFATYAIGMLALSGFPLVFSGFWSKDEILHSAYHWGGSSWLFYLGLLAALLTAFYMTRQMLYVFFGKPETAPVGESHAVHESPGVMVVPLIILAFFAVGLGFVGTPMWPWFQSFLENRPVLSLPEPGLIFTMILSSLAALGGIALGWIIYRGRNISSDVKIDPLESWRPDLFSLLRNKYYIDEAYAWVFVRFTAAWGRFCALLEDLLWAGLAQLAGLIVVGFAWLNRFIDEYVINFGFDMVSGRFRQGGGILSRWQNGKVQNYLRAMGLGLAVLVLVLLWGCRA
jgi:NADH-quinone oxidoreductase subunit L